ncbi:MAG: aminotransferase class V-fold PLP-dependent enzyme, partial [Lapillicoccus sp.]
MRHYLDHAATTPMRPAAVAALTEQLARTGNASSLHTSGRLARRVVEESRESIAQAIGCRPSEVVFTSGGTESDNLAVQGTYAARRDADPRRTRLLVSTVEHHAVLDCVDFLAAHEGAKVTWLECDELGRISPDTVRAAIAA